RPDEARRQSATRDGGFSASTRAQRRPVAGCVAVARLAHRSARARCAATRPWQDHAVSMARSLFNPPAGVIDLGQLMVACPASVRSGRAAMPVATSPTTAACTSSTTHRLRKAPGTESYRYDACHSPYEPGTLMVKRNAPAVRAAAVAAFLSGAAIAAGPPPVAHPQACAATYCIDVVPQDPYLPYQLEVLTDLEDHTSDLVVRLRHGGAVAFRSKPVERR